MKKGKDGRVGKQKKKRVKQMKIGGGVKWVNVERTDKMKIQIDKKEKRGCVNRTHERERHH